MKTTDVVSKKMKKNQNIQSMTLISVNVIGSTGLIRLIVKKDDVVSDVISRVLKLYAREGRVPVLGYKAMDFQLLCLDASIGDLDPETKIGECDNARSFMLWKKVMMKSDDRKKGEVGVSGKGSGVWKSLIRKSFKIAASS